MPTKPATASQPASNWETIFSVFNSNNIVLSEHSTDVAMNETIHHRLRVCPLECHTNREHWNLYYFVLSVFLSPSAHNNNNISTVQLQLYTNACLIFLQESGIGTPVTLRVDPKGFFLYWADQNNEIDLLDIALVRDVRTGPYAKKPRVSAALNDSIIIKCLCFGGGWVGSTTLLHGLSRATNNRLPFRKGGGKEMRTESGNCGNVRKGGKVV